MFKATRPDAKLGFGIAMGDHQRGATPAEYLDRLGLHNQLFSDEVRLEGVLQLPGGKITITTSPPVIKMKREASAPEIDQLMAAKLFTKLGDGVYHDLQTRAAHLRPLSPQRPSG